MNQNMGRLIRYILIIHRLSGNEKYVPSDSLISYLNLQMDIRGYEIGISQRTLQRDIKDILSMFEVEIKNYRGRGYYIAERPTDNDVRYEELLTNFDLLMSLNQESQTAGFIIPEHHRPKGCDSIPTLIKAIKDCSIIRFDYRLVRKEDKIITRLVKPHYLKESLGLWYLLALDERDNLRLYAIDRISNLCILDERFKRDESINPDNLFKHSYGIWDDPGIPIDEVELSYSPLDGKFIKTTPLHSSQEILVDNEEEFRIRLHIRITNDFVMALLERSSSLTVIRPSSLRRRIYDIYRNALKRNEL
ncbi:WYL domain-containing transcriptional regulator [Muribaculaceae bacterium Isolate-110 (HZI)]|nr:WYL domain-containing transcriptional regulator [Muribaculaceae bacterium Isolate-110 (HZI)]